MNHPDPASVEAFALAIADALDSALTGAVALARDLADARDLDLDLDLDRIRDLDLADTIAGAVAGALDLDGVRVRDLIRGVIFDLAGDRVSRLANALALAVVGRGLRATVRVAWPAARLAAVGARLLPGGDRGRYAAEYLSELWDLADAGAGRWRQVRHAFLLTARVPELRGALREPRRRNAAP